MDRMKTFLVYVLLIIGFFAVSTILENGLLLAMYSPIQGEFNGKYDTASYFDIENATAKSCNINGYMSFDLLNSTGKDVKRCYLKIELYNEQNLLADTEYVEILNMNVNEKKHFDVKFEANNIETFAISIAKDAPDMSNIVSIFGWEIDLTDVFGLGIDVSNVSIFGNRLIDYFKWDNVKSAGKFAWKWIFNFATGIPLWAYGIGWMIAIGVIV